MKAARPNIQYVQARKGGMVMNKEGEDKSEASLVGQRPLACLGQVANQISTRVILVDDMTSQQLSFTETNLQSPWPRGNARGFPTTSAEARRSL